jgi:predicted NBD/HSP70 family sugar kinase
MLMFGTNIGKMMPRETNSVAGMHPSVLRRANSIEVFHAIRLNPHISQREISACTGVDKSTVSTIVAQFDILGLLSRVVHERPGRRGRPSETLLIKPEAALLIGVNIVPEKLVLLSAGLDGNPVATSTHPRISGVSDVVPAIETALSTHLAETGRGIEDVRSIGVCIPGLINSSGRLAESSNMRWHDVAIRDLLVKRFGPAVWVSNDARGAGLAEKLFGCCIDVNDYLFIDSHSGVGGALFLGGSIYTGAGGFAGELGHCKVVPYGRICDCGASGCLSAYVSEPALKRRFATLGLAVSGFQAMAALADAGNSDAVATLEEAGEMLGMALSDFINLFNPPNVVLGGGLAVLAPHLLPSATRVMGRQTLASAFSLSRILVSDLALQDVPRGPLAVALEGLSQPNADGAFPW